MKKIPKIILSSLVLLSLAACSQEKSNSESTSNSVTTTTKSSTTAVKTSTTNSDSTLQATSIPSKVYGVYNDNSIDTSYDESQATKISFSGANAGISGEGATIKDGTLTINAAGTYILTGTFTGQVVVNTNEENVHLVLNNAEITSSTTAAIYIEAAKNAYVTLADGTTNTLTDASKYTYADANTDEPDAALFSKADLFINGTGSLNVTGNYNNGIRSKDDLVITGGKITVNAKNNALKGKDSVSILAGEFNLTTTSGDAIQANNTEDKTKGWIAIDGGKFTINAGNDGIQAETKLSIADGEINIKTADGYKSSNLDDQSSYKGLKSGGAMIIDKGTFTIDSADDALHSNDSITINNGTFKLATGDDGIHADNNLTINDGKVTISDSYEGLEASVITINGGTNQITSSDDGLNAGGGSDTASSGQFGADSFGGGGGPGGGDQADDSKEIKITGGTTIVNAEGDGVDSNGNVTMTDGVVLVNGPTKGGNGALDYNGTWTQKGGTLLAVGTQDMAMTPSDSSSQASLGVYLNNNSSDSVSVTVDGKVIFTYQPEKSYQHIAVSTPGMTKSSKVTITQGATNSTSAVDGYSANGSLSGGTKLGEYSLTSGATSLNQDGSTATNQGMGGGPGGGR